MSERKMHMTLDEYGRAIRAAFEQGYLEGVYHPDGQPVIAWAERIGLAFWTRALSSIEERLAAVSAPRPS